MTNPDCISIREQLSQHPGSKLGFVVYRLTYSDDARWVEFMHYLNTRIRLGLEADGEGDLFQHIDWDVQEDPELEDAEEDEIRRYGSPLYLLRITRREIMFMLSSGASRNTWKNTPILNMARGLWHALQCRSSY
jgi:hypothetical protein